jgi:hypothetical protein
LQETGSVTRKFRGLEIRRASFLTAAKATNLSPRAVLRMGWPSRTPPEAGSCPETASMSGYPPRINSLQIDLQIDFFCGLMPL